jgi:HemX protein
VFAERWVIDFIIYLYTLSLLFSFSDLLHPNRRAHRLALGLLVAVWLAQSAFFAFRLSSWFPALTSFDALFFYSWMLITFTLLINAVYRMDLFVFSANLISFVVMTINLFVARDSGSPVSEILLSELVFIHVTMALVAYAAFSLSAVFSVLYLIGNTLLKQKRWNRVLRLLPSLDRLQSFSHRWVLIGVPLMLLSMILGLIWLHQKVPEAPWYDPKIAGSLLVFAAYGVHLYFRLTGKWQGRRLAWWNLLSFFTVLVNMSISGTGLSFHRWL